MSGTAASVALSLGNFTFCPACIETNYLVGSIKAISLNESACLVNDQASYNLTIRATTTLVQKVAGNVVDGLCINTAQGCWDGTKAIAGATVTATIPSSSSGLSSSSSSMA